METKKSKKASLEGHSGTFFLVGLIISISLVLFAFEYKSYSSLDPFRTNQIPVIWDDPEIINTVREKQKVILPKIDISRVEIVPDIKIIPEIDYTAIIDYDPNALWNDTLEYEEKLYDEPIYEFPQILPVFQGGDDALVLFLHSQVHYPSEAASYGAEGTVHIQFTITSTGEVRDIKVLRGVDYYLDQEAIRVVKSMPRWTPAQQGIRKVATYMRLPFKFTLNQ